MIVRERARRFIACCSIRDVTGRLLQRFQKAMAIGYNRIEADVAKQAAGVYVLTIETASGEKLIKQFVIN